MSERQFYVINMEEAGAVAQRLLDALPDRAGTQVDARDVIAGFSYFVFTYLSYLEDSGLGEKHEWYQAFDYLLRQMVTGAPEEALDGLETDTCGAVREEVTGDSGAVCLALEGHVGPHDWRPDNRTKVSWK